MKLIIHANKSGYSTSQVRSTMTVAELKYELENYDDDIPVYLSFDNGYTYGGITSWNIEEKEDGEDE